MNDKTVESVKQIEETITYGCLLIFLALFFPLCAIAFWLYHRVDRNNELSWESKHTVKGWITTLALFSFIGHLLLYLLVLLYFVQPVGS